MSHPRYFHQQNGKNKGALFFCSLVRSAEKNHWSLLRLNLKFCHWNLTIWWRTVFVGSLFKLQACNLHAGSVYHFLGISTLLLCFLGASPSSSSCSMYKCAIRKVMSFLLSLVEWDIEPSKCLFISVYLIVVMFLNCQLKVRDKLQPASDWKAPLTQLGFFIRGWYIIYWPTQGHLEILHAGNQKGRVNTEIKGPAGPRFAGGTVFLCLCGNGWPSPVADGSVLTGKETPVPSFIQKGTNVVLNKTGIYIIYFSQNSLLLFAWSPFFTPAWQW